jgi:Tol biopolymer transport system component
VKSVPRLFVLCCMTMLCLTGCRRFAMPVYDDQEITVSRNAESTGTWDGEDTLIFSANGDLVAIHPQKGIKRNLTLTETYEGSSSLSPNGRHIAVAFTEGAHSDLFIAPWNSLGDTQTYINMTQSPDYDEDAPSWSPDGREIAFSSYREGNWGIFTAELLIYDDYIEPILLRQRRLTVNTRFEGHPAWSPDGQWIAYTSDRGFRWQIYLSHTSGLHTIPMTGTTNLRSTAYPAWSPDGSQLAFASTFDSNWDIYVMNIDGGGLKKLTSHSAADWHPAWSPDGNWIAFVSNRSGVSDIYLISADGMDFIQLTDNDAVEDFPVWQISEPVGANPPTLSNP